MEFSRLWARLTRCRCRTKPYLEHITRTHHFHNGRS